MASVLLHKAAEQGYADAQYWLSRMYFTGTSALPRDFPTAAAWCCKAFLKGNSNAQVELASMCALGLGVPQDDQMAVALLHKANGEYAHDVQYSLGFMYANGRGVPQDDQMAVALLHKAAELGNVDAQRALGNRYLHGLGVPKDDKIAAVWFYRADEREAAEVQFNLELGWGPDKDLGEPVFDQSATQWFRQLANQGDADASYLTHVKQLQ